MDIKKLIRSFGYALEGISQALKEQNVKIHVTCVVLVVIAGLITGLSVMEWAVITLVMAVMVMAEMLNTAIERVVDLASPDIHPLAKQAKDIAAGAVLVFAVASVIIGLLIFLPKWAKFF